MNTTTSKANELEKRLTRFAASIVTLSAKLPRNPQGRHVCLQILAVWHCSSSELRGSPKR
jgi:hypothetical protein